MSTKTATLVTDARTAATRLRQLYRHGGGSMATVRAEERHGCALRTALAALVAAGRSDLAGLLEEEDKTAERLDAAKLAGQDRPELRARLLKTRKDLRAALTA